MNVNAQAWPNNFVVVVSSTTAEVVVSPFEVFILLSDSFVRFEEQIFHSSIVFPPSPQMAADTMHADKTSS